MRRLAADRKGQFIVIAVLMISIMIISIGTIMYSSVTYYRHERWEEYLGIVDNVEISAYRLLEFSLANYTTSGNASVLTANLDQWQRDLLTTYAQFRVVLAYYNQSLSKSWNTQKSFSISKASFSANITSVGLTGYRFTRSVLLNLNILNVFSYSSPSKIGVEFNIFKETMDGTTPLTGIRKSNILQFKVNNVDQLSASTIIRYYDTTIKSYVYELQYPSSAPATPVSILISMTDYRNINVIAQASFNSIIAK